MGGKEHRTFILSSLKSIERVFASPNSRGPYAVAAFLGMNSARTDAFQRVSSFIKTVRKDPQFAGSEHI